MKKVEVIFSDSKETEEGTIWRVVRKMSAEGEMADISVLLVALGAEWEQFLPAQAPVCDHCGERHESIEVDVSPEVQAMQEKLTNFLLAKYGPNAIERLHTAIVGGMDAGAEDFANQVMAGLRPHTSDSMLDFVNARIRQNWLSEFPDFPEDYLDEALTVTTNRLREVLKL